MTAPLERLTAALAGRYEIEREIGQGGMATVFLAQDIRHRRKVAIKVLHPELTAVLGPERFLNEIELTANLQHPHILPLFDSGTADTLLFYVMPYVQGETLRNRLSREHQLPVAEALRIAGDVADALEYAHKHGVVHRDIKPENILLHDGRPLVADFGIALAVQQAGGERMTQTGMSLGTPQYMAPEQAMGDKHVDHRADIYALGAVTYEMLTGEPPFTGANAQAVVAKILTTDPSSLVSKRRSVPPHVDAAVLTALEKMPADRFGSAAQFGDALAGRGATLHTRANAVAAGATPRATWQRKILAVAPWSLAVAALALAAVSWMREPEPAVTRNRVMLWQASTPPTVVGRFFGISRDGRTFAYVDTVGGQRMWLKERDQLDATALAGTTDAFSPTFSPDGEWIAFASDGRIKKVPRLGGSPIVLADSAGLNPSIAWLDGGTILFTTANLELLAVDEEGGESRRVVTPDSGARGVVNVTGIPGGRGAVITSCRPGCDNAELRSLNLKTGEQHTLASDALQGWVLDDHLVFVRRDGGVFSAPFDRRGLKLSGQPVPVFNGVRTTLVVPDMTVSPSGTLVYVAGQSQAGVPVQPVWVSRSGQTTVIDTAWSFIAAANWGMALSPDGTRLAVGARSGGSDDIWIKELRGGALRRLTFEGVSTRAAAWTPDGRSVIYISSTGNSDMHIRNADGTGTARPLVDISRGVFELALTPDTGVYVLRVGQPPSRDILLYRPGATETPLVTSEQFHESWPMVSRDGKWLAYGSNETGRFEVYVRPFPDVNAGKWQVSRNGGNEPYWAHNGRELFYRDQAGNIVSVAVPSGSTFAAGEQRVLFPTRGFRVLPQGRSFDVAPDDSRFVFTRVMGEGGPEVALPIVLVENWGAEIRKTARRGR